MPLYLALELDTAVVEYQQVSPLLPPGTLVSYEVSVSSIVDFTRGYQSGSWNPLWEDFYCDWRSLSGSMHALSRRAGFWVRRSWPQVGRASSFALMFGQE